MTGKFVPSQTTDGRKRRKRRGNTQKMKFFETAEFYFRVGSYKFSLWYRGECSLEREHKRDRGKENLRFFASFFILFCRF